MIKYFLAFLIVSFFSVLEGQELIYQNFGVDEGLSSSEVYDVYQDKEGYMWFATDKGLSRYNGYEFDVFDTNDGLTGNVILRFYPQKNGQVWCYDYHNKSLFFFDEIFRGFKVYKHNKTLKESLGNKGTVKSLYLDELGNLSLGVLNIDGELVINKNGDVKYNLATNQSKLNNKRGEKQIVLRNDDSNSFFVTSIKNNDFDKNYTICPIQIHDHIGAIWLDKNRSSVFMGTDLIKIKNEKTIIIDNRYKPIGLKRVSSNVFFAGYLFGGGKLIDDNGTVIDEFLKDKSVTNFLIDHEGGYWFSTLSNGVYYSKKPSIRVLEINKFKTNEISSLSRNNNNELLIAYKNGNLAKLTKQRLYKVLDIPNTKSPAFIEYDSTSGFTYVYNDKELKNTTTKEVLSEDYIIKISEPVDGHIFASGGNSFREVDNNNEIHSPYRIQDVCMWKENSVLATPLGVFIYNGTTISSLESEINLLKYRSDDIDISSQRDKLFIATQGAGLVVYDDYGVYNITKNDGLNSNNINEVYLENDTSIWLCTNKGLNRVTLAGDGIVVSKLNRKQGFLNNEVIDVEIMNDTVWAGTKHGVCYFPKTLMNQGFYKSLFFKLKEIKVNNKLIDACPNLDLKYNENKLDIFIEDISYVHNEDIFYQYRLNRSDLWTSIRHRKISFAALPPGNYSFEAKVCIDDNNCAIKLITYQFNIQYPFWRTSWFYTLCLLVFIGLIYSFFRIRIITYNKDIFQELIRLLIKRLKRKEQHFSFREKGKDVKIKTTNILFVKSSGNYIDIKTVDKMYTVRMNIGKFLDRIPDKLEYIRVHRSYIVRLDKITSKSKNEIFISTIKIPVSQSYLQNLEKVFF